MFDAGTITSNLELDRTAFAAGLRAARMEAQSFARERYTAKLNVDLDDAAAKARLDRLAADDKTVHANLDLDIGAAEAKIALLKRQAAGIGGGIGGGGFGGGGGNFIGPGSGPLSFLINHPLLGGLIGGAPFLPTIGASAVQGALGAGALGTGLAGAGLVGGAGIVATAVPALSGLSGALEAYSLQQKQAGANAIQMAQQQTQAAAAQKAAAQQVQNAETSLGQAQQQEKFAQEALTQARADAVRQLQDMRRAALESGTAEKQARINLQMAQQALRQGARQDLGGLQMDQLRLSVKEAQQALQDAHIQGQRARQDASKAQRQGIDQMPQVVAAQRQVQAAHQGVQQAAEGLKQAEQAQTDQMKQARLQAEALAASNDHLSYAMSKLPPAGQQVFHMLIGLKDQWRALSEPAQNQFFGMLGDGIREAEQLLPMFARSADQSTTAARGAFDHFFQSLDSADFHTFVNTMSDLFAEGIGPMERGVENIFHVLGRIAVAAAPDVLRLLQGFASTTHQWEVDTRNASDLQHHVHETVQQFGDWYDLAQSLGHVLSALFITNEQGARKGGQEVEAVAHQLDSWARWIEHHHHDINHFFGQLNDDFGLLLSSAGEIASVVLPAFKPVGDIIHEIVTDLNSIKVGNVSALTVLLGIMVGRGIAGKLGLVGAGAAAGGGLTAAEAAGAGAGGAGGIALSERIGQTLLTRVPGFAGGAAAGAGAAVAFQSLAGKPGTFLGPGIAGFVPQDHELRQRLNQVLKIQSQYHSASLAQLQNFRDQAQRNWFLTFESDPAGALAQGGNVLRREAKDTFHDVSQEIRSRDLGTSFADAVAAGGPALRDALGKVKDRFSDVSKSSQDSTIEAAKNALDGLKEMGLITNRQERQSLSDLEDIQRNSLRRQRQRWDQFGQNVNSVVGGWFGSMAGTVNTILGNQGITGMVNQLLVGVASQHKLKWNATTVATAAGHLIGGGLSGLLGDLGGGRGGQRGGFTGGYSGFDDRMIAVRGGEAILRPEDHVPIVSRALQSTYGFGLGDLFSRTGAGQGVGRARGGYVDLWGKGMGHFARGGMTFPLTGNYSWGRIDQGVDFGGSATIRAMGDATVLGTGAPGWPGGGGVLYRLAGGAPRGFHPASDIIYNYEHVSPLVHSGQRVRAGQPIGRLLAGYPGLEIGFATSSGGTLAQATSGYSEGQVTPAGQAMMSLLRALSHGANIPGGIGQIPRILIHGPGGGIHDGLQGIADMSRRQANRYLNSIQARGPGMVGGPSEFHGGGDFLSTAYGPPWGGIQGTGVTATGIDLTAGQKAYIVAVDPSVIPLHSKMNIWPNPFGYRGKFGAEDTGGAILGNRIDFYDWLGRSHQLAWGERNVKVEGRAGGGRIGAGEVGLVGERAPELLVGRRSGGADVISPGIVRAIARALNGRAGRWQEIRITNWRTGEGQMREVAGGEVDSQTDLDDTLDRMHR